MSSYKHKKPPVYTEEQLQLAVELAVKGETIKRIIDEALLGSEYSFWLYRQHYPDFNNAFEQARQEGLEPTADALTTIADEYVDVQRARLKSDNLKWLLSKRKPEIYGDKVDIHVSQTIDISSALNEARSRAALPVNDQKVIDIGVKQIEGSKKTNAGES